MTGSSYISKINLAVYTLNLTLEYLHLLWQAQVNLNLHEAKENSTYRLSHGDSLYSEQAPGGHMTGNR